MPPSRQYTKVNRGEGNRVRERTKYKHCPSRSDNNSHPLVVALTSSFSSAALDSSFSVAFMGGAGLTMGTEHRYRRPLSHNAS